MGAQGAPGSALSLHIVSGQAKGECAAGETMISAYCASDGSALHIDGSSGAACDANASGAANAVVVCVKP
jgi:hypothetical protein